MLLDEKKRVEEVLGSKGPYFINLHKKRERNDEEDTSNTKNVTRPFHLEN